MGLLADNITRLKQANNGMSTPSPAALKYFAALRSVINKDNKVSPIEPKKPDINYSDYFSFNPGRDFENINWK